MYRKIFVILTASGFFSMAAYLMMLYSRDTNIFVKPTQTTIILQNNFWKNFSTSLNETAEEMFTVAKVLPTCPENSPHLVGPLLIEFNFKVNMDEMIKEYSGTLQEGGRYKPPDCVSRYKVAIIIPFRNRYEHLEYWLYYLHPILIRQQLDYGVFVINQDGEGIFNRAKLMNVGFAEALKVYDFDCFVFSDVDLVPLDDRNLYRCFDAPRHLAVAMDKFGFGLPYKHFYGGVSALSKSQYISINGFSNTFWGWGGEDDDIYNRIVFRGMSISRPDMVTGKYRMIKHKRDLHNEPNPHNPGKLYQTKRTIDRDGMNTLKYTVKKIEKDVLKTFITVDIEAPLH